MPTPLADRTLRHDSPALAAEEQNALAAELGANWELAGGRLRRTWKFPDFASALAHAVKLGLLSEKLDHHPDLAVSWGKLTAALWTHRVNGLTEADFIWAARAEKVPL